MIRELRDPVCRRVLDKLNLSCVPTQDLDNFTVLYRAWCRNVPFDNVETLLKLAVLGPGHLPALNAEEFFENWLEYGIGGLCVPTALAWCALLCRLSFDARLVACSIDQQNTPNHLSVVVRIGGCDFLADTVNLCERPLLLSNQSVLYAPAVHVVTIEPAGQSWRLRYRTPVTRNEQSCVLLHHAPVEQLVADLHTSSQTSDAFRHFNRHNYSRRNTEEGVVVVVGSEVIRTDLHGTPRHDMSADVRRVLTSEIGYSLEIAQKLPILL